MPVCSSTTRQSAIGNDSQPIVQTIEATVVVFIQSGTTHAFTTHAAATTTTTIIGAGAYFAALSVILHDETSGDGHPMTPPTGR